VKTLLPPVHVVWELLDALVKVLDARLDTLLVAPLVAVLFECVVELAFYLSGILDKGFTRQVQAVFVRLLGEFEVDFDDGLLDLANVGAAFLVLHCENHDDRLSGGLWREVKNCMEVG